jgi:DNA-binding XRE family transcriptional regulator
LETNSKASSKIKELREALHLDQGDFSNALDVAQSLVSSCETGNKTPSSDLCVRLGNLAAKNGRYSDAMWFWQRAGLRLEAMLAAANSLLKQRGELARSGKFVGVPPMDSSNEQISLPGMFVTNPASTAYLTVSRDDAGTAFSPGDIVVFDTSETRESSLWGSVVVLDFIPRARRQGGWMEDTWPEGLSIGRLNLKSSGEGKLVWRAELGPLSKQFEAVRPITIGYWQHPLSQKSIAGPDDVKAQMGAGKEAESRARSELLLRPGCHILGRAIGWFKAPEKKK